MLFRKLFCINLNSHFSTQYDQSDLKDTLYIPDKNPVIDNSYEDYMYDDDDDDIDDEDDDGSAYPVTFDR